MRPRILLAFLVFLLSACASLKAPVDRAAALLDQGELVQLRVPATLKHGHDMEEPPYDAPEGYRPIPTYPGELLLTDRRILFVVASEGASPSWVSIPYPSIARARPSRTQLLHYIVVWDLDGHADSFLVDASNVKALHRSFGEAMMSKGSIPLPPATPRHLAP